jgi:hypothetical protein
MKPILVMSVALGFGAFTLSLAEAEELPFKAMLTGNAHLSPTDDPSVLRNDETGEGEATHLGRFTWADVEFADFGAIPGGVSVVATFTMTAADGDELYGEFTSVGYFADPQTLVIQGEFEFTGGTGRFADATGSGEIDAFAFLAPGLPFIGTIRGSIDY